VRLIDENGEQIGVFITSKAVEIANQRGLDLVEVAPDANPPVAKILDYGKFKYEKDKKEKAKRKEMRKSTVKEIKFRPKTEEHDYNFKLNHIKRFIESGHKVKVTMMFRGRELSHIDIGEDMLKKVIEDLGDTIVVERDIKKEGRNLYMMIAPNTSD
jgi:translation initiation factor IF-3